MQILFPSLDLQPYIQHYFFPNISTKCIKDEAGVLEVYPSASTSLILFFTEPSLIEHEGEIRKYDDFVLTGYYTTPKHIQRRSELRQMIIRFTPLGIQGLLNFSLSELTDSFASVESIFYDEFTILREELNNCDNNKERVKSFERSFKDLLSNGSKPINRNVLLLCEYITLTHGTKSLKDVSEKVGLGERTIQRLINNYIGINFKLFSRLVRFSTARESLGRIGCTEINLTDLAYQLNYFDQSHFIHDFKDLSDLSPMEYRKRISKSKNVDLPNLIETRVMNTASS